MPNSFRIPMHLIPYSQKWFEYASTVLTRIMKTRTAGTPKNGRDDIGECWIPWNKTQANGYVKIGFMHRTIALHRFALTISSGHARGEGLEASHACGTRACFNPEHLSWKTRTENQRDRFIDGTHSRGQKYKPREGRSAFSSQYAGVHWSKRYNRWVSYAKVSGITKYIGSFKSEDEAGLAYNEYVKSLNATIVNPRSHYRLNDLKNC